MSRKEDFEKSAMDYCEDHSHCIQFEFGAEYGYQYAVDKACEWLQENLYVLRTFKDPRVNKYEIFIRMLRGAMEE